MVPEDHIPAIAKWFCLKMVYVYPHNGFGGLCLDKPKEVLLRMSLGDWPSRFLSMILRRYQVSASTASTHTSESRMKNYIMS